MSTRALSALIGDLLATDACLAGYLDSPATTTHGAEDFCDMPVNAHPARPIRRTEQGWPGDFSRAVLTYGRLSRSPFSPSRVGWIESWTFQVGIWVRETVQDDAGERSPGDLWAHDIYDSVVRVLGWMQGTAGLVNCDSPVFIARKEHVGDVVELHYDNANRLWELQTRFRWAVVSRGLAPAAPTCCDDVQQFGPNAAVNPGTGGGGGGGGGNGGAVACGFIEHDLDAHDTCEGHA